MTFIEFLEAICRVIDKANLLEETVLVVVEEERRTGASFYKI